MLRQRIGLNPASVGETGLERSIARRMAESGYTNPEDYARLLSWSPGAWRQLVEELVVAETWFFREEHVFARLGELPRERSGTLRILSLPCSTGEEAWSAAITLLEAGCENFTVQGIDVSEAALNKAREGVYGQYSFRGGRDDLREKYFDATADGWRVQDRVRAHVSFAPGNVAEGHSLSHLEPFDAIFFRNLCIYLEPDARVRAFHTLHGLSRSGGDLYVAVCEAHLPPRCLFAPRSAGNIFGRALPPVRREPTLPRASTVAGLPITTARPAPVKETPPPPPRPTPVDGAAQLSQARRLADQGKLAEARQLCEGHQRRHGPSAQAAYLLAMICSASGESEQKEHYLKQALFLEPDHEDALTLMAVTAQHSGNKDAARRYQSRLSRAVRGRPLPTPEVGRIGPHQP